MLSVHTLKKLAKSDTSRDTAISVTGQGLAAVLGAVFFAITARILGPRDFGLLALSFTTAAIIKDIVGMSATAALVRFIPLSKESAIQISRLVIRIKIIYLVIISCISLLAVNLVSFLLFKESMPSLVLATLFNAIMITIAGYVSGFLQAHKRFTADAVYVALQPFLRLLFATILIYLGETNLISFVWINGLVHVFIAGYFLSRIDRSYFWGEISKDISTQARTFMIPMATSTITGTLLDRISIYITNFLLGPAAVGVYAAVQRLFIPVQQVGGVYNSVLGSRFARFDSDKKVKEYTQQAMVFSALMAGAILMSGFIARPIVSIIYGQDYVSGVPLLRILSLGFAFFIMQVPFSSSLVYYKSRTDLLAVVTFLQLFLSVAFTYWLTSTMGIQGTAWAYSLTFISYTLIVVLLALKSKRKL